ncbi:MAG: ABC transporter permease [Chloroflexota bacterium]
MATVSEPANLTTTAAGTKIVSLGAEAQLHQGESNTKRSLRRLLKHRMAVVGIVLLAFVILYVSIGSLIYSEAYANHNDPTRKLEAPSSEHPFGTDSIGRDLLARTIYGGQISILVGVTAVIVSLTVGTAVGLASGYFGGIIDTVLMRLVEAALSIPQLFVALLASRMFAGKLPDFTIGGREFSNTLIVIVFAIGLTSWMQLSRIVRSMVLSIKQQEYITAARALGAPSWRIVMQHILPNCLAPIIVAATLGVASAILLEAYLSFLGLGVRAPTATWGNMLFEAYENLQIWNQWFFPALFVILTVLGINFFGDGLRDAFDPRSLK